MLSGLGIGLPMISANYIGDFIVGLGGLLGLYTGGLGIGGLIATLLGVGHF